jgi:hypothetical protein
VTAGVAGIPAPPVTVEPPGFAIIGFLFYLVV